MKFKVLFITTICNLIILTSCNEFNLHLINMNQFESIAQLEKECEQISNENHLLCEKLMIMKTQHTTATTTLTKVMSRVQAVSYDENNTTNSTDQNKNDLFNLAMPINTCRNEDCEFCCLSTNRCGTKKQCTNRENNIKFFNGIFCGLCIFILFTLIIKCYRVDHYPDQTNTEKIDNHDLNELINMFGIIKSNRRKLIT